MENKNNISCPFCERQIHINSAKCRYCGNNIKLFNLKNDSFDFVKRHKKGVIIFCLLFVLITPVMFFWNDISDFIDDKRTAIALEKRMAKEKKEMEKGIAEVKNEMEFVYVESGEFNMGSNSGESDEKPIHKVIITKGFYIGKYEVTQGEWKKVMGSNPSYFKSCGDNCPVEQVSWNDIQEFIKKLNQKEGTNKYKLPTEAEWEYAARGGNKSRGYKYSGSNNIGEVAEYDGNNNKSTKPVGGKKANELGIHDMSGNVYEWVQDIYDENYYSNSSVVNDPINSNSGEYFVLRGGSWFSDAYYCRVAARDYGSAGFSSSVFGFRLSRTF